MAELVGAVDFRPNQPDAAGQTVISNGQVQVQNTEPAGPNTPLATDASGNQLFPGPGYNASIDRPNNCVAQTVPPQPSSRVPHCPG